MSPPRNPSAVAPDRKWINPDDVEVRLEHKPSRRSLDDGATGAAEMVAGSTGAAKPLVGAALAVTVAAAKATSGGDDDEDAARRRAAKLSAANSMKHQDPLTATGAAAIFASIALPNMAIVACLSTMGRGMRVFNYVAAPIYSLLGDALLLGATSLGVLLGIFDWWYMAMPIKVVTSIFPCFLFVVGSVCKGRKYPWGIMVVLLTAIPVLLGTARFNLCKTCQLKHFYAAVSGSALVIAIALGAMWGWYVFMDDNEWDSVTQYRLIEEAEPIYDYAYKDRPLIYDMDCGPYKNITHYDKTEKAAITKACSQAGTVWFLCYMCPGMAIGCDLFIFVFCMVNGVVGRIDDFSAVQRHLTRFALGCAFLLSGMYATATMSATSIRLGSTLLAFFGAALCLLCIWVWCEIDHDALVEASHHSQLMTSLIKVWHSEWIKAMICAALCGPAMAFLVLNKVTQTVRKMRNAATNPEDSYTPSGRMFLDAIADFPWTRILLKVCLLGELFFMLQVGVAKATYVFLSWLNTSLADASFILVLALVYLIGSTMFLLPPVPGLPVYVFAGILIGEKGRQNESIGFWLGCAIAVVLSLFTKLCACVGQYMIGFGLGKSIKVQQLIGVDKVPTRAIEMVLKSRGLNPGKVSVLVGGPDWPTSVTCGIVRVNVAQMLIGTLPVVTLLAPCILAGACMGRVKPGEDSIWNMAASGATAVAAVVNMASMAYAVYTIGEVIEHHGDDLAKPRPEHEAVAALTRKEQSSVDMYNDTIRWDHLSSFWRFIILASAALMLFSNGMFVMLAEMCFRTFAVSSKINDPYELDGLEGSAINIVIMPVGGGALGLFFFGWFLHTVFGKAMGRKAKMRMMTEGALAPPEAEAEEEEEEEEEVAVA